MCTRIGHKCRVFGMFTHGQLHARPQNNIIIIRDKNIVLQPRLGVQIKIDVIYYAVLLNVFVQFSLNFVTSEFL